MTGQKQFKKQLPHRGVFLNDRVGMWVDRLVDGVGCGLVAKLCVILATPWAVAYQAPLSMGFSRQKMLQWVAISFPRLVDGCDKWNIPCHVSKQWVS